MVQKLVAARARHWEVGISSLPRSRQSPSSVYRGHESSARGVLAVRFAASQFDHVAGGGGWATWDGGGAGGGLGGGGSGGGGGGGSGEGGGGGGKGGGGGEGGGSGGSSGGGGGGGGGGQRPQLSGQARSTSSHAVVQKLVAARARHWEAGICLPPRS